MVVHQSFRPSDFGWRDLPLILVNFTAAPLVFLLRATGFWPVSHQAHNDNAAGVRPWRKSLWRIALVLWLLLPLFSLIVCFVSTYGLGRGWLSHSTAMTLSRPAFLMVEQTPLKDRFAFLLMGTLNQGLKDGERQIGDVR